MYKRVEYKSAEYWQLVNSGEWLTHHTRGRFAYLIKR